MKKFIILFSVILAIIFPISVTAADEISVDDLGNIIFIGDSYCEGANVKNDHRNSPELGWAQKTIDYYQLKNAIVACLGGTGFVGKSPNGTTFRGLLDDYYPGEDAATEIKWIMVSGGYNDQYYSYDEIMIEGEKFVNHATELYPNAKIAIGMNGWHADDETIRARLITPVTDAYYDLANYKGLYYINGSELALDGEDLFSNDDFHPNEKGEEQIAYTLVQFINGQIQEMQRAQEMEKSDNSIDNVRTVALLVIIAALSIAIATAALVSRQKEKAKKLQNPKKRKRKHWLFKLSVI